MEELSAEDATRLKILKAFKETETETFNYAVPLYISKPMIYLDSIRRDLELVIDIAEAMITLTKTSMAVPKEMNKEVIAPSLWYTLIISYGRCFAKGITKLEVRDCFSNTSEGEKLKETHRKLIRLRNEFIAHRFETEYEQSIVVLKLPKVYKPNSPTEFRVVSTKLRKPSNEDLQEYLNVFHHLLSIVKLKMEKHKQKMNDEFFKLKPEYINQLLF